MLFLVLSETDGFLEEVEGTFHSETESVSGLFRGREVSFRTLYIRGLDGVIAVVETTSRVQTQTVEELLEELGPQFQKPLIVKDVGGTEVPGSTRIKELKNGDTLTLFLSLRGGGLGGMPPKGGKQQTTAQRNEFVANMGRIHRQTRQEETER